MTVRPPRRAGAAAAALAVAMALSAPRPAPARDVADASGRVVHVDRPHRILPADQAAALLLAVVAPDRMLGWPLPLSTDARARLSPAIAALPVLPPGDVTDRVRRLRPDLVLRYGPVGSADIDAARALADRIDAPMLVLDDAPRETPHVLRLLGQAVAGPGDDGRAETLARMAEAMLALHAGGTDSRVVFLQGPRMVPAQPGSDPARVLAALGWTLVAPPAGGDLFAGLAALDPDLILSDDPGIRADGDDPNFRRIPAVAAHRAFVVPALPFGWLSAPNSVNRLLGMAWLGGADGATAASLFDAAFYGRVPNQAALAALERDLRPVGGP